MAFFDLHGIATYIPIGPAFVPITGENEDRDLASSLRFARMGCWH